MIDDNNDEVIYSRPANMLGHSLIGAPPLPLIGLYQDEDIVNAHREYQERYHFDYDQGGGYPGKTEDPD